MTYESYRESGGKFSRKHWEESNAREEEEKARVREELAALLAPRVETNVTEGE